MTQTLPGADIRGYYAELGIQLPAWAHTEASVRCFADPQAHHRGDQDPSCSVNLKHGSWHCHGCSARGGAFDAATMSGLSDRCAIDLMVRYGLTQRRTHHDLARRMTGVGPSAVARRRSSPARSESLLTVEESDVQRWQRALAGETELLSRLAHDRGWRYPTLRALGIGIDREQLTIPTRDHEGRLIGLLRYQPWAARGQAKIRAARGSQRVLLPHPAAEPSRRVILVEGEPDMISTRSHGAPAIAVPGADGWRPEWSSLLAGRHVIIVMDCDAAGRRAAHQIANDLEQHATVAVHDLCPARRDGYDLTDYICDALRNGCE